GGRQGRCGEQHGHHGGHDEERAPVAEPAVQRAQGRRAQQAAEEQEQVQHVDEQRLAAEQGQGAEERALAPGRTLYHAEQQEQAAEAHEGVGRGDAPEVDAAAQEEGEKEAEGEEDEARPPGAPAAAPGGRPRAWARPRGPPARVPASTNAEYGKTGNVDPCRASRYAPNAGGSPGDRSAAQTNGPAASTSTPRAAATGIQRRPRRS